MQQGPPADSRSAAGPNGSSCLLVLAQAVHVHQCAGAVIAGAVLNTGTVWLLSEIVNGLMAVPNLIALAALSGEAAQIAKDYKRTGGTYEDIHQCQPLRAFAHAKVPSSGGEGRTARQKDPPSEYRPA
jgi:hypothetical protein